MKVKVWNDNVHPYKEKFREQDIVIPAKGFIEMDYDDALSFKGSFAGILKDADNQPVASGFKMIRLDPEVPPVVVANAHTHMCQVCRYLALDEKDLGAHLKNHASGTETAINDDRPRRSSGARAS